LDLEYGKLKFDRMLATGGQGMVCLYRAQPPKNGQPQLFPDEVAVKFDPGKETANLGETLWLKEQTKQLAEKGTKINIPTYYLHSFKDGRRYLIISYLP
jgi:hypothetical protein